MNNYEEEFMKVQIGFVEKSIELIPIEIDYVYLYSSIEKNSKSFNVFCSVDGDVMTLNQTGLSLENRQGFLKWGTKELDEIIEVCNRYSKPVPNEIKFIYNNIKGNFTVDYKYEEIATANTGIDSSQIFMDWILEVKGKEFS